MTNNNLNNTDQKNQLPENIEILANQICEMMKAIELAEELLKVKKIKLETWKNELSEMLDTCGYAVGSNIVLKNGKKIAIKEYFSANIPSSSTIEKAKDDEQKMNLQERRQTCFEWLIENNLNDIIKNNIEINLIKGEDDKVQKISDFLNQEKVQYQVDKNVHHSTLTATLKELIKKGINVPFSTFNITTGTMIDIK